jgi:hypothetical protein
MLRQTERTTITTEVNGLESSYQREKIKTSFRTNELITQRRYSTETFKILARLNTDHIVLSLLLIKKDLTYTSLLGLPLTARESLSVARTSIFIPLHSPENQVTSPPDYTSTTRNAPR